MFVLSLVGTANSFQKVLYYYDTQIPLTTFIVFGAGVALVSGVLISLWVVLFGLPGESLAREYFPASNNFDPNTAYSKEHILNSFLRGVLIGLSMIGYVVLFYWFSSKFVDIWTPLSPDITGYLGDYMVFLGPIVLAATAAFTEEISFRLLRVSLCKKYLKNTFVALLVPAAI